LIMALSWLNNHSKDLFLMMAATIMSVVAITIIVFLMQQQHQQAELESQNIELDRIIKTLNQTQIILHEDLAREKQMKHEDEARANQSMQERHYIKEVLEDHDDRTKEYIVRENNTTQKKLDIIINQTRPIK
jgi:hypothetical protein